MKLRWKALVLAFGMAVALWYGVSGSEKVESILEVRVDYRGLPAGHVVRNGLVNKIEVRVRAPIGIVRTLSDKSSIFYMDLSSVKKGENILSIDSSQLPFRRNVEVMDITPSRITLDVDINSRKTVPLSAEISGPLKEDHIAQVTFFPPEVMLTGPSEDLDQVAFLPVKVNVDEEAVPGTHESVLRLILPEGMDAAPPEVRQTLHIGIKRKLVTVTRNVEVEVPDSLGNFIRPDKVKIQVAMPVSMAGGAASDRSIRAFAQLDRYELGSYTLPVLVILPAGAELVKIEPEEIAVTLEQKKTQPQSTGSGRSR